MTPTSTDVVVGVFLDAKQADGAVAELGRAGFSRKDISVIEQAENAGSPEIVVRVSAGDAARVHAVLVRNGAVRVERESPIGRRPEVTGRHPGAEPLSEEEIRRETLHYAADRSPAYEWENMTAKEREHAAPPEEGTIWPHKHPVDAGEDLLEAEAGNL